MIRGEHMSFLRENFPEIIVYSLMFLYLGFTVYETVSAKSFDRKCDMACGDARSATPIIDFRNQCLCDEGHGKWKVTDVP